MIPRSCPGPAFKTLRSLIFAACAGFASCFPSLASAVYWNVFNVEGESSLSAAFVTYATITDMATDTNRTGLFIANGTAPFGNNIVGSGSDVVPVSVVPASGSLPLLGIGLVGMILMRRGRAVLPTSLASYLSSNLRVLPPVPC